MVLGPERFGQRRYKTREFLPAEGAGPPCGDRCATVRDLEPRTNTYNLPSRWGSLADDGFLSCNGLYLGKPRSPCSEPCVPRAIVEDPALPEGALHRSVKLLTTDATTLACPSMYFGIEDASRTALLRLQYGSHLSRVRIHFVVALNVAPNSA